MPSLPRSLSPFLPNVKMQCRHFTYMVVFLSLYKGDICLIIGNIYALSVPARKGITDCSWGNITCVGHSVFLVTETSTNNASSRLKYC